jgi:tRNA(Arg) A34 adenosine deaminase TadA
VDAIPVLRRPRWGPVEVIEMAIDHEAFMRVAMEEARRGGAEGNLAVGSVVVRDGRVIGRGRNLVNSTGDPTDHAETVALRDAARALGGVDLSGCLLYTTIESCPMCCGAVMKSGIGTLVLGARFRPEEFATQRFGAYSVEKLIELAGWGDRLQVVTGVLSQDCYEIRREWESRSRPRP